MSQLRVLLRANFWMLVSFGNLTFVCAQRFAGFMMVPIALIALIALLYQTIRLATSWRMPGQRAVRLTALSIVLLSMLIVGGCHAFYHQRSRAEADRVVALIERFYAQNQRFPNTLDEVGVDPKVLSQSLWVYTYGALEGRPFLDYYVSLFVTNKWSYDFSKHEWVYKTD